MGFDSPFMIFGHIILFFFGNLYIFISKSLIYN